MRGLVRMSEAVEPVSSLNLFHSYFFDPPGPPKKIKTENKVSHDKPFYIIIVLGPLRFCFSI